MAHKLFPRQYGTICYISHFMPVPGRRVSSWENLRQSVTLKNPAPDLDNVKRVAFVPRGGIGDTLVMTSGLEMLKTRYPHLEISIFSNRTHSVLLDKVPGADRIIPVGPLEYVEGESPHTNYTDNLAGALYEQSRDKPQDVYFFSDWDSSFGRQIKDLSGYKVNGRYCPRIVTGFDAYVSFLTAAFIPKNVYTGVQYGAGLLAPFFDPFAGFSGEEQLNEYVKPNLAPGLFLEGERDGVKNELEDAVDFSRPIIYLNLFGSSYDRAFTPESAVRVINELSARMPGSEILVNGGTNHLIDDHPQLMSSRQYIEDIRGRFSGSLPENVIFLPRMSIARTVQLLSFSTSAFTVDTGVAHLLSSKQLSHVRSAVLFNCMLNCRAWGLKRSNGLYYSRSTSDHSISHDPVEIDDRAMDFIVSAL